MATPNSLSANGLSLSTVSSALVILCSTYIVYKLISMTLYIRHLRKLYENAPGPEERHWLYGNVKLFPTSPPARFKYMMSLARRFRRYFCVWVGPARVIVIVNHPDTVKAALKASSSKPTGFSGMYRFALPWLGTGLLIADGARWARSRRLLTPAFHFDILKPYVAVYNEAVDKMINNMMAVADTKESCEVFTLASRCTLDIILRCAFSYETDCQKPGPPHPYLVAVSDLAEIWFQRERRPHLFPDFIFNHTADGRTFLKHCDYVHSVAEKIITKRKEALENAANEASEQQDHQTTSTRKYMDFLDTLLTAKDEQGNGMSLLDIRNEVDTFMFEGHDTTASGISWTLYSLAQHPAYQKKVQEEIDNVLAQKDTDYIDWSDLPKLEYLTMCIKESLRHYSPVPFISRELSRDLELDGRVIPAGTTVALHIYGLHHNVDVWREPYEYRPERFSKENIAKMDSYQYIPFSAGARNCIGQHFALNEEKVVLARLFRRFMFSVDGTQEVHLKTSAVLRSHNGLKMHVTSRCQT